MNGLPVKKQSNSYFLDADERGFTRIRADLFHRCFLLHPRSSASIRVQVLFLGTRAITSEY